MDALITRFLGKKKVFAHLENVNNTLIVYRTYSHPGGYEGRK